MHLWRQLAITVNVAKVDKLRFHILINDDSPNDYLKFASAIQLKAITSSVTMAARAVKELWSAPRAHSLAEVELFSQVKVSISCTLEEKFWTRCARSKRALLSYLVMRNLH